jgi:hypothetical protein
MMTAITNLTALKCRSCGAPEPLGAGKNALCPRCGAGTPIPPEYVELRALRTRDASQRRAAEKLLKKLDRPAWLFTKIVARVFDQPMFLFWMFYAAPLMFVGIIGSLILAKHWAWHLGLRSADELPSWEVYLCASMIFFVFALLPRVIGVYAGRRAAGRARLLAGLLARPPSTSGGPALCRNCGAPLEVAKDALVAHCLYCETDNVIEVRTPLRDATRHAVAEAGHALHDAVALDHQNRRGLRRTLLSELKRYGVRAFCFIAPICVWGWDYDRSQKTGQTPGWGLLALCFITIYLISMMLVSLGRKNGERAPDAFSGNDVPEWVGWAGPVALWTILYVGARLFQLR